MNGKFIILINSIRRDQQAIAAIYAELERHPLSQDADNDVLIVIAYHLHNLYNAFENVFQNIAAAFENSVEDDGRWHAQLLERMRLNALPLRPAVIDDEVYAALDELRRFRHLFRHAYIVKLDPPRLRLVWDKASKLESLYQGQLEAFVAFVQELVDAE